MSARRVLPLLWLVLLTVGLLPAPAHATEPDPPQLRREGRWLVDQHGRVVLVHGMNLVFKHDPYVPPNEPAGFTAADARWLYEHGFNGARIGTLWAGVTPERPGVTDETYLDAWQRVIDLLAEHEVWMQFDFHQDQWHETYGGGGVPDWAVHRPAPYDLLPPVTAPFPLGYWTPEVSTVFDQFWANEHHLLDGWADAWQIVARRWRDQPYSMGYDLLNEPWAGMEWPDCLLTGCPGSYPRELQPAMEHALRAIRQADPDNIVYFEPQQFAGGREVPTNYGPVSGEDQLGYSWHNYCPQVFFESQGVPGADVRECEEFSEQRTRAALDQGERMRAVGVMSEFGATDNIAALKIDTAVADRHFTSWLHWAYKTWRDPTTADSAQGMFTDDADLSTAKPHKLRTLVRTYPQATAGTPMQLSFDPDTGDFHYVYRPRALGVPSVIFVSPLHYPDGYTIDVDGGHIADPARDNRLRVTATGGGPVAISIRRR